MCSYMDIKKCKYIGCGGQFTVKNTFGQCNFAADAENSYISSLAFLKKLSVIGIIDF